MSMIWPIALVIFSNIIYQICAKGVPKNMDVMASMTITYLVLHVLKDNSRTHNNLSIQPAYL